MSLKLPHVSVPSVVKHAVDTAKSAVDTTKHAVEAGVHQAVDAGKHAYEKAKPVIDAGNNIKKAVTTGLAVKKSLSAIPEAAKALSKDGFVKATKNAWSTAVKTAENPKDKLGIGGIFKRVGGAASTITGAISTFKDGKAALHDIRQAIKTHSGQDIRKAIDSSLKTAKDVVSTAKSGIETARDLQKFGSAYKAATSAFKAAVPNATKDLVRKVGVDVAKAAFSEGRQAVRSAAHGAVETLAKEGTTLARLAGAPERAAARALLRGGERAAAHAGLEAAAHAASGPLAKVAGRFVPGANVALAAYDTYQAVKDIRDPNASTGKKITSGITALGSIAAATNIPVVSQVGAAVSTVSSLVGGFFFSK